MHKLSHIILGIAFLVIGVMGVIGAGSLPFMARGLPAPGFFPMVMSVLGSCFSCLSCSFPPCGRLRSPWTTAALKRVGLFLAMLSAFLLVLTDIIGLLPGLGLFYALALRRWNGLSYGGAICNGIVGTAILYVVFVLWLRVNMPWGVLYGVVN